MPGDNRSRLVMFVYLMFLFGSALCSVALTSFVLYLCYFTGATFRQIEPLISIAGAIAFMSLTMLVVLVSCNGDFNKLN